VRRWHAAVHDPGIYDFEVDTSRLTPEECADRDPQAPRRRPATVGLRAPRRRGYGDHVTPSLNEGRHRKTLSFGSMAWGALLDATRCNVRDRRTASSVCDSEGHRRDMAFTVAAVVQQAFPAARHNQSLSSGCAWSSGQPRVLAD